MVRGIAAVIAFAVCFQSAAFAGTKHVCRYTGRILAPCECPEEKAAPAGIGKQPSCSVKPAQLPGLPEARVAPQLESVAVVADSPAVPERLARPAFLARGVAAPAHGPPRLYVTLRQLLL